MESNRIGLLFEMGDRRKQGDAVGAERYFDEAVALRRATPSLDARTASRVDMRLAVRMYNNGDRAGAKALAESSFAAVLAATTGPAARWLRYSAARSLAQIVAADGDLKRARALYEEYVFPVTDNAVASGDAVPASRCGSGWLCLKPCMAPRRKL